MPIEGSRTYLASLLARVVHRHYGGYQLACEINESECCLPVGTDAGDTGDGQAT